MTESCISPDQIVENSINLVALETQSTQNSTIINNSPLAENNLTHSAIDLQNNQCLFDNVSLQNKSKD